MVVFTSEDGVSSDPIDPRTLTWRAGSELERTIYAVDPERRPEQQHMDVLIGVMDSPDLAAAAVEAHNQLLALGNSGSSA